MTWRLQLFAHKSLENRPPISILHKFGKGAHSTQDDQQRREFFCFRHASRGPGSTCIFRAVFRVCLPMFYLWNGTREGEGIDFFWA